MDVIFNGTPFTGTVTTENLGAYDIAYDVSCTEPYAQELINWMSINCQHDFVVTQTIETIVAGGRTNNKLAFTRGRFDLTKIRLDMTHDLRAHSYNIRMMQEDHVLFKLVWIQ